MLIVVSVTTVNFSDNVNKVNKTFYVDCSTTVDRYITAELSYISTKRYSTQSDDKNRIKIVEKTVKLKWTVLHK